MSSWYRHIYTGALNARLFVYIVFDTGACNVFVGHPIDLIKVRAQTASPSISGGAECSAVVSQMRTVGVFRQLRNIFVKEGVAGLYRGVSAPLLAVTPAFAISFWSYDLGKTLMRELDPSAATKSDLSVVQNCMAGAFSGLPLAAVVGPSERIKCLMQVEETSNGDRRRFNGFVDCLRQVYREGGYKSVFRGLGATCMRDVPGNAAYFGTYELMRREVCRYEQRVSPSLTGTLFAGGMAGVANWIVAIPFDVVKSRLQTAPHGKYRNLWHVFHQLILHEGVPALFRGLAPALLRAFPANAACLAGVETARSLFSNHHDSFPC